MITLRVMLFLAIPAIAASAHSCHPSGANASDAVTYVEKEFGDRLLRVVEYEEQYGEIAPNIGQQLWRSVLCVEIVIPGVSKPRRVWQYVTDGRLASRIGPDSIVVSNAANDQCIIAYTILNAIFVGDVRLNAMVEPLQGEVEVGPQSHLPKWRNSKVLVIPSPLPNPATPDIRLLASLGKREIGMGVTRIPRMLSRCGLRLYARC